MAHGRHQNTLFEAIPSLCVLLWLIFSIQPNSSPLIFGTIFGFFLQTVALIGLLWFSREMPMPSFTFTSPVWRLFWPGFGITLLGQVLMSSTTIIDQTMATHLEEGSLSTMGYANRIAALLLSLGAVAIPRASLPIFSRTHLLQSSEVLALTIRWSLAAFASGCVVILLVWFLSLDLVSFVFQRGAFSSTNSINVSRVLNISLIQIPFFFSGMIFVSALASKRMYTEIALGCAVNLLAKVVFSLIFLDTLLLNAVVISNAVMYGVSNIFLFCCLVFAPRLRIAR